MSETKGPQASSAIIDHCDHMTDEDMHWHGMTIRIGPKRVIALCKDCTDQVIASVLTDIMTDAARHYLPKLLRPVKKASEVQVKQLVP